MSLQLQEQRWRSGKYVGEAKPTFKGYIRRGRFERHFQNLPPDEVFSFQPGVGGANSVWFAEWVPEEDYVEVPNILHAEGDIDFDQKGIEQVTVEIDNLILAEQTGIAGVFHEISRGHMSPLRGEPGFNSEVIGTANEWRNKWRDAATQIILLAGYGDAFFPVFLGLLDDCDLNSRPDRITVTARSMGKALTDQRAFMDAKNLWIRDPITFCDRRKADEVEDVSSSARAKSTNGTNPERLAIDGDEETAWVSARHGNPDELEWIEVYIPHARVEDFDLFTGNEGMEMYVSVHATDENVPGKGKARDTDGKEFGEGWISEGLGNVPGTTIPFVRHIDTVKEKDTRYKIRDASGGYLVGDNSKVRLWFRRLGKVKTPEGERYRASVRTIRILSRERMEEAKKNHWILVDDVSDIVRVVLQWAGFRADGVHAGWEIESTGVRLAEKLVFDRQTFLMDIIWKIAELTSYVFFVKPPGSFDAGNLAKGNVANLSVGTAVFRQNSAMRASPPPGEGRYMIRDTDLLRDVQPHFSNEGLADSIRVRGTSVAKAKKRNNPNIHPLGADRLRRYQYSYRPVWAREARVRSPRIRKPVVHYDEQIDTVFLAKVGCLMIALRLALESAQAQLEFPCFPPIFIDNQLVFRDTSSALSTRVWVAKRSWEYQGGKEARFSMSVAGSLIDVPDVTETVDELRKLLNQKGWDPSPIARGPWTEPKFF
jgi:hypothetical protein